MSVWRRRYYRGLNAAMRVLLRSPLHPLRSGRVMLLEFSGRRSGRRYLIPVSYWERPAGQIICLSSTTWARWWLNLDDADVVLYLYGQKRFGHATLVDDPEVRLELISGFLRQNPQDASHYGVERDRSGRPLDSALQAFAESPTAKVIDIRLLPQ